MRKTIAAVPLLSGVFVNNLLILLKTFFLSVLRKIHSAFLLCLIVLASDTPTPRPWWISRPPAAALCASIRICTRAARSASPCWAHGAEVCVYTCLCLYSVLALVRVPVRVCLCACTFTVCACLCWVDTCLCRQTFFFAFSNFHSQPRVRTGAKKPARSCRCWSAYSHWFWCRSPSSTSPVMSVR